MKILLITDDFFPNKGGVAHTLNSLCRYFQKKQDTLYIVNPYFKGKNIFPLFKQKNYKLIDLLNFFKNKNNFYFLLSSISKIFGNKRIKLFDRINLILYLFTKPKLLAQTINNVKNIYSYFKEKKIDLIFSAHSGNILPLAFILSRLFNKKIVSLAHGLDFVISSYFSLKTFYFKYIDKIIVSNNWIKRLLIKIQKINENKIRIIHRGLILSEFEVEKSRNQIRKEFNISEKVFVILSVGRHISRKNFDLIIKALKILKDRDAGLDIKYYSIGTGPMTSELKTLTNNLKLTDYVEFLGSCDTVTRNKFYKLSDVFIMPAITEKNDIEGFGIVFLEANYYKTPVIGSYSGGIVEAIEDGKTGFLIKPNDLNGLVEKIYYLYKNENERSKLGENGYKRVILDFNWDNIINDYIDVFKTVLST